MQVNPIFSIDSKVKRQTRKLSFNESADFNAWKDEVKEK